jgi:hypothetical protein
MKLTFAQQEVRNVAGKLRGLSRTHPSLQRARSQLSQAVGALSSSLEVLGDFRFGGGDAERAHQRLRDVVERDRALRAAQPSRPSAPKKADASSSRRDEVVAYEPIRTRTMARLLAAQGYRMRALAIYDELLAGSPEDAALRDEAEAVRKAS